MMTAKKAENMRKWIFELESQKKRYLGNDMYRHRVCANRTRWIDKALRGELEGDILYA